MTLTLVSSLNSWAAQIRAAWQSSLDGILECGQLLIGAKGALPHGEFLAMIENDLPFKRHTASMLMAIARDLRLVNGDHGQHLPPSWRTLYELTKLDDAQFQARIADGTIHPDMGRGDLVAAALVEDNERHQARTEEGCTVEDLNLLISAGKKFGVIYADPPWQYKVYSGKGKSRSADRRYTTKPLDDIKALPVAQLAEDDCALLMWAVMPELPGALEVIKAWGFTYKTVGFTWVKQVSINNHDLAWGMGYWTRANAELCLLATKGSPRRQAKNVHQVIMSPVGEHSRKPEETSVRIEKLLPGPYLELYGRRPMHGWTVWGNEINKGLFHQSITEFSA